MPAVARCTSHARFSFPCGHCSKGDRDECLHALHRATDELTDPEAMFYAARTCARMSAHDEALAALAKVVGGGYFCCRAFVGAS